MTPGVIRLVVVVFGVVLFGTAVIDACDDGAIQLTSDPPGATWPTWSPDGNWIVFSAQSALWKIPASGGVATRLTDFYSHWAPDWSNAGDRIAFCSVAAPDAWVCVMPAGDGDITCLPGTVGASTCSWSPDDSYIAYDANSTGQSMDILVIPSAGGPAQNLTNDSYSDDAPDWSPDGSTVLFSSNRGGGTFDLWTVPVQGGTPTRVTWGQNAFDPAWSPDGRFIAFWSEWSGRADIYVMDVAGGGSLMLTCNPAVDRNPAWSPDGRYIVFTSDRGGPSLAYNLWVISIDLAGVEQSASTWGFIKALFR